jgi:hypothetical protein
MNFLVIFAGTFWRFSKVNISENTKHEITVATRPKVLQNNSKPAVQNYYLGKIGGRTQIFDKSVQKPA